jgi:hypothetical protein
MRRGHSTFSQSQPRQGLTRRGGWKLSSPWFKQSLTNYSGQSIYIDPEAQTRLLLWF